MFGTFLCEENHCVLFVCTFTAHSTCSQLRLHEDEGFCSSISSSMEAVPNIQHIQQSSFLVQEA